MTGSFRNRPGARAFNGGMSLSEGSNVLFQKVVRLTAAAALAASVAVPALAAQAPQQQKAP